MEIKQLLGARTPGSHSQGTKACAVSMENLLCLGHLSVPLSLLGALGNSLYVVARSHGRSWWRNWSCSRNKPRRGLSSESPSGALLEPGFLTLLVTVVMWHMFAFCFMSVPSARLTAHSFCVLFCFHHYIPTSWLGTWWIFAERIKEGIYGLVGGEKFN